MAIPETQAAEQWRWKVESAASTLREFFRIKRTPKLYNAAIAELKKQRKEITQAISSK